MARASEDLSNMIFGVAFLHCHHSMLLHALMDGQKDFDRLLLCLKGIIFPYSVSAGSIITLKEGGKTIALFSFSHVK